jgi:hypothetical protein
MVFWSFWPFWSFYGLMREKGKDRVSLFLLYGEMEDDWLEVI